MSKYKIIMTGGGTAGHVTPNIALFPVVVSVFNKPFFSYFFAIYGINMYNVLLKNLIKYIIMLLNDL